MLQQIIGVDLAKRTSHTAVVPQPSGKPRTLRVTNTAAGAEQLLRVAGGPSTVVLEPTGLMWVGLSSFFIESGCTVVRADTRKASDCRKMVSRNAKTDAIDALALTRVPGIAPEATRPLKLASAERFSLERLVRLRAGIVDEATRAKERLLCELEAYIPDAATCLAGGSGWTAMKRVLVADHLDPFVVRERGVEGLRQALAAAGVRINDELLVSWVAACEGAASLFAPARRRGTCPVHFEIGQETLKYLLDALEFHEGQVADLDRRLAELAAGFPEYAALQTIPGIGPLTSAYMLARLDVRDFATPKHMVSYLGLAPRVHQTGIRDGSRPLRISKTGDTLMRQYLYMAAETARRTDLDLAAMYERLVGAGKHHQLAVTAIAAKLVHRVYAVLKRAAAGKPAYEFRDTAGVVCTAQESRKLVTEKYPTKAARARDAKKGAVGAPTLDRGSRSSPKEARRHRPQPDPNPSAARVDNP